MTLRSMSTSPDKIVSLFSGAGGCSLGFAAAGLKPSVAADIDPDACNSYGMNLGVDCDLLDLSSTDGVERIIKRVGEQPPFAIVGGPPCQGFSAAGPRKGQDPRNRLIYNYLSLISRLKPRWLLFENVEGLLTSNGGKDVVGMAQELRSIGYSFRIEKVNFAGYGLPQTRKRVIIVGNKMGHYFRLPHATFRFDSGKSKSYADLPFAPTLLEAIGDLPRPSSIECELNYGLCAPGSRFAAQLRNPAGTVAHHWISRESAAACVARHLRPGETAKDLPPELQHESFLRRANRRVRDGTPTERRGGPPADFRRLRGDLNALTITGAAYRDFIHPLDDRSLTLRECARLQSFADAFRFEGNAQSMARQIGNAIPPLAAQVLAQAILLEDGKAGADVGAPAVSPVSGLMGFRLTEARMSPALAATAAALDALMNDSDLLPINHNIVS